MIQTIKTKTQFICYDTTLLTEPTEHIFDASYWQQEDRVIGSAQGRGTTWFIQLNKVAAALRHYRRGGLFGRIVKDNYFFAGWEKTRSIAEFNLLNELQKAQVNVPRPIAARSIRKNALYRADLISEKIPNARDLVAILQTAALPKDNYIKIGEQIRKMHQCQVNHTDLNIHNILIDDNEKVWIIDFDKCKKQSGEAWKKKNLQRLLRSFNKEVGKREIQWREDDWLALLKGYEN